MSAVRSLDEWLDDIVRLCERIERHLRGVSFADFDADERTQDAVAKCVESPACDARAA